MSSEEIPKNPSRRHFLKCVGTSVVGVSLLSAGGFLLSGCSSAQPVEAMEAPEWPYTYVKLDAKKVQERAYNAYFDGG